MKTIVVAGTGPLLGPGMAKRFGRDAEALRGYEAQLKGLFQKRDRIESGFGPVCEKPAGFKHVHRPSNLWRVSPLRSRKPCEGPSEKRTYFKHWALSVAKPTTFDSEIRHHPVAAPQADAGDYVERQNPCGGTEIATTIYACQTKSATIWACQFNKPG
jgi:hypothetical protein